ncbi:MAG: TIGR01458 family HAD-type hydrolase [Actinomycetota bacterium]
MQGVEGVLLDVDGVLVQSWRALPGAPEALAALRAAKISVRFLTNTTALTRAELGERLHDAGLEVEMDEVLTAPAAAAAYLRAKHPGARCYLIAKGDVAEDLDGVELVDEDADVVLIGGAEENFTYDNLNRAFRMLMDGAALVTMHRNLYWKTDEGLTLDAGAFVVALEHASGAAAVVTGKPAKAFFAEALRALGAPAEKVAMVGDDVDNDVLAAQDAGLVGVLVRTGKFTESALEHASGTPDLIVDSVRDVPALLG